MSASPLLGSLEKKKKGREGTEERFFQKESQGEDLSAGKQTFSLGTLPLLMVCK